MTGWRDVPLKQRLKLPRQPVPDRPAAERIHDMNEVALGLSPEQAVLEAQRCLQCGKKTCIEGCPVGVDIPRFLAALADADFAAAARIIREKNLLPAICGRVCPQETQCQRVCAVTKALKSVEASVGIGPLERFAADWERAHGIAVPALPPPSGRRIAVVGAGPAGLTAAGDLAQNGHAVTVFEALHRPGGVLAYGIPRFRLPREIVDAEVAYLERLGVAFRFNFVVGKTCTIDGLFARGYEAIFLGTGAGLPSFLDIPGENLCGVYSANEYLTRTNLMGAYEAPAADTPLLRKTRVAVVGGGNVAMDAARVARRLGADVTIVYRRSEKEMPARLDEVRHAKEEGIVFELLQSPVRVVGDEQDWVSGLEIRRMELGEPGADGRRRPIPVPGSERVLPVDTVIVAIGNAPHPLVPQATPGLQVTSWGGIVVDPETQQTSLRGVFAGGDIVLGAATVILAMGQGRRAARAIEAYLAGGVWTGPAVTEPKAASA